MGKTLGTGAGQEAKLERAWEGRWGVVCDPLNETGYLSFFLCQTLVQHLKIGDNVFFFTLGPSYNCKP